MTKNKISNKPKNITLYPENINGKSGFNIYIDFSGQRELLMTHRHNGALYNILKNGIKLDDLTRYYFKKKAGHQSQFNTREQSVIGYLLKTIDEYLIYSM